MSQTVVKNISLLVTNNPSIGKTELGLIENAALLIEHGKISWVGQVRVRQLQKKQLMLPAKR
jgi:imidazolonepropionase